MSSQRKEEINEELEELQEEIINLEIQKEEIENSEDDYEEFLNHCYGTVEVCGMTQDQGTALRELDEVAFNEGWAAWTSEKLDEINDKINEVNEQIDNLEEELKVLGLEA